MASKEDYMNQARYYFDRLPEMFDAADMTATDMFNALKLAGVGPEALDPLGKASAKEMLEKVRQRLEEARWKVEHNKKSHP